MLTPCCAGPMAMVSKHHEFCVKMEELCIKNKEFRIKNDELLQTFGTM